MSSCLQVELSNDTYEHKSRKKKRKDGERENKAEWEQVTQEMGGNMGIKGICLS